MKPPPFYGKEKLLRKWTLERLWREDDEVDTRQLRDFMSVFAPGGSWPLDPMDLYNKTKLRSAKAATRRGNSVPLRAIVSAKLHDPEIAEFIAAPGPRDRPNKRARRRQALDTIQRIHRIWREEHPEGKWKRRGDTLAGEIAAEYCDQTEDQIAEALKRQSRRDAK